MLRATQVITQCKLRIPTFSQPIAVRTDFVDAIGLDYCHVTML